MLGLTVVNNPAFQINMSLIVIVFEMIWNNRIQAFKSMN